MKKIVLLVCLVVFCFSCQSSDSVADSDYGGDSGVFSSEGIGDSGPGPGTGNGNTQAGQITAGEWNDLSNWDFWTDLLNSQDETLQQNLWNFEASKRIAIQVLNSGNLPVNNAKVALHKADELIFEARTDNFGEANVFINLFNNGSASIDISEYSISINDVKQTESISMFKDGVNTYTLTGVSPVENRIELAFIVDATGSMSDELEFLKNDLTDVISKVQADNANSSIFTGTVFYRDHGDEYVTRLSDFSTSVESTSKFIKAQSAGGGGDFPEAVDVALDETLTNLQWSTNAKTKIAFLLLDAPPHTNEAVNASLKNSIISAAKNGVKIIPIVASGIDKPTEFLMRYFAIATNGTYVFITNDSGIGNDHLEPTVGDYDVEFLNDLLVRLINKYAK